MAAKKGKGMDMAAVFGPPPSTPKGPMAKGGMDELAEPPMEGEEDEEGDAILQEVTDTLGIDRTLFIEAVKVAMTK